MRQDDPFINTAINGLVPAAYPAAKFLRAHQHRARK